MERFSEKKEMTTFKQYIQESINDKGRMKAIFFAGTPGAGKSYTRAKLSAGDIDPRVVNTDKFYEYLAKKMKIDISKSAPSDGTELMDKSKLLTKEQLFNFVDGMLPLFIDGTSSDINNVLLRSGVLESLGYDVGMVFINTDLKTSLGRIQTRGRHIESDFVEEANKLAAENREYYKGKFDFFIEINNSEGELTDEVIEKAFKKTKGFFTAEIKNPIGKRTIKQLEDDKEKYLVPSVISQEELQKKISSWYRK